jgi:ubiquinone/menaquinone biosynthesis C-methylase UbiE
MKWQSALNILKKQSFQPNALNLFINPFFFIRRGLNKQIRKNSHALTGEMLDFGCGRKPYKNLFKVSKYVAVDIEVSGHSHKNSEVDVFYNGENLPFPNEVFGSLFCSEVLEHVFNLEGILSELHRVLKKGAQGLITTPFALPEHEVPYDFARYTSFGIKAILERNEFKNYIGLKKWSFY